MKKSFILLLLLPTLAACGGSSVKETLGLNRRAPDEFRVVSRPPLSVPPEFNLRPPSDTAESPIITPADEAARAVVTGAPETNTFNLKSVSADTAVTPVASADIGAKVKTGSAAENQLLMNAGAAKADPNVRSLLRQERADIEATREEEESSWWRILPDGKKEPLVDANGEAERIEQNKTAGKPVTEGDTPETKERDTGVLGKIFGY